MPGTVHETAAPAWANSAGAGTAVDVTITTEDALLPGERHAVTVRNPSTETALTVAVQSREEIGGTEVFGGFVPAGAAAPLTLAVPVNSTRTFVVDGWLGHGGRLRLTNDGAVGLTGGFTADVVVREIG